MSSSQFVSIAARKLSCCWPFGQQRQNWVKTSTYVSNSRRIGKNGTSSSSVHGNLRRQMLSVRATLGEVHTPIFANIFTDRPVDVDKSKYIANIHVPRVSTGKKDASTNQSFVPCGVTPIAFPYSSIRLRNDGELPLLTPDSALRRSESTKRDGAKCHSRALDGSALIGERSLPHEMSVAGV